MFLALHCITERINRCPRSVTRLFFNQLDVTKIMTCVSKALAQTAFVLVFVRVGLSELKRSYHALSFSAVRRFISV